MVRLSSLSYVYFGFLLHNPMCFQFLPSQRSRFSLLIILLPHFLRSFIGVMGRSGFFLSLRYDNMLYLLTTMKRRDCIPANGKVTVLVSRSFFFKHN